VTTASQQNSRTSTAAHGAGEENPVEIANLEISQSYSFTNPLLIAYGRPLRCADGTPQPPCADGRAPESVYTRRHGPVDLTMHFNPAQSASVDLGLAYDLVNRQVTSNSVSGWYRWASSYVNATWYRQSPAGAPEAASSQLRLGSGAAFFNRKLTLDGDLGYDLRGSTTLDGRGRVGYYTQCCGFVVEYLNRSFLGNQRREIRFVIDLKGIGRFLDLGGVSTQ